LSQLSDRLEGSSVQELVVLLVVRSGEAPVQELVVLLEARLGVPSVQL
jgi:hypothetical protein